MTRAIDHNQAVILSGGGAYGAYEVGVMQALFTGESPSTGYSYLNPGIFTGTSVGALNAAYIVSRASEDICATICHLASLWIDELSESSETCGNGIFRFRANPLQFLNPACFASNPLAPLTELAMDGGYLARDWFDRAVHFLMASGSVSNRTLELVDFTSLISSSPLARFLKQNLKLKDVRNSERRLRVIATDWDGGAVVVFENRHLTDEFGYQIIQGSAALPGFFQAQLIDGHPFVDGGVLMNTPLKCAIQAGGSTLHVIYMDPDVNNIPLHTMQSTINTLDRILVITSASKVGEDIDTAAWINEGLAVIERVARGEALVDADMQPFIRVASQIYQRMRAGKSYRKLTIHRYHPHDDLGGGALGLLNFNRDRMVALIDRGFDDALNHDCAKSHCILPT